ncbi:hypothetical protein [Streptomyces sp. NPDC048340]|uniref:hypothetical protein n=1 Tax=Streptomyces sp. NPDC048340 TaxID=3365537 RepID=UPI00371B5DCA
MPDGDQEVLELFAQHIEKVFQRTLPDLVRDHDRPDGAVEALRWFDRLSAAQDRLRQAEDALVEALGAQPGDLTPRQWELAHRVNSAVVERDVPAVILKALLDNVRAGVDERSSRQSTPAARRIHAPAPVMARPHVVTAAQGLGR